MTRKRLALTIAISGMALIASQANAQSVGVANEAAAVPDNGALADIVVTAQRRQQKIQDVPISVTSVTGDQIEARHLDAGISGLGNVAPSLNFSPIIDEQLNVLQLRGIGGLAFDASQEPDVAVVVDGVNLARNSEAYFDLIDLERVEVLNGPQGTLFGKNASAGVINLTTKKPTFKWSGAADVNYSWPYDERILRGTISGPISDSVAFRVTASGNSTDGVNKNLATGKYVNGSRNESVRAKLLARPAPGFELVASFDWRSKRSDCCIYQQDATVNPLVRAVSAPLVASRNNTDVNFTGPLFNNVENYGGSLEATWKTGSSVVTSISSYRVWDQVRNFPLDALSLAGPTVAGLTLAKTNGGNSNYKTFTQELRIASDGPQTIEYVAGLYYFRFDSTDSFTRAFQQCFFQIAPGACVPGFTGTATQNTSSTYSDRNYSAFGDVTWNINNRLSVFGGVRLIYEKIGNTTLSAPTGNATPIGPGFSLVPSILVFGVQGAAATKASYDDFAPAARAGARFKIDPNTSVYASYSHGYKGQAISSNDTLGAGGLVSTPAVVRPTTTDSVELGIKSNLFSNRLNFALDVYRQVVVDPQTNAIPPNALALAGAGLTGLKLTNVGKVIVKGVELTFQARPTTRFSIYGAAAYTDGKTTDYKNIGCYNGQIVGCNRATNTQDLSGKVIPNVPKWRFNISERYDQPVTNDVSVFEQVDLNYQSERYLGGNLQPLTLEPGYAVVNLSAGVKLDHDRIEISGFIKNLFDKRFRSAAFDSNINGVGAPETYHFITRDAFRTGGITARYRF